MTVVYDNMRQFGKWTDLDRAQKPHIAKRDGRWAIKDVSVNHPGGPINGAAWNFAQALNRERSELES